MSVLFQKWKRIFWQKRNLVPNKDEFFPFLVPIKIKQMNRKMWNNWMIQIHITAKNRNALLLHKVWISSNHIWAFSVEKQILFSAIFANGSKSNSYNSTKCVVNKIIIVHSDAWLLFCFCCFHQYNFFHSSNT